MRISDVMDFACRDPELFGLLTAGGQDWLNALDEQRRLACRAAGEHITEQRAGLFDALATRFQQEMRRKDTKQIASSAKTGSMFFRLRDSLGVSFMVDHRIFAPRTGHDPLRVQLLVTLMSDKQSKLGHHQVINEARGLNVTLREAERLEWWWSRLVFKAVSLSEGIEFSRVADEAVEGLPKLWADLEPKLFPQRDAAP